MPSASRVPGSESFYGRLRSRLGVHKLQPFPWRKRCFYCLSSSIIEFNSRYQRLVHLSCDVPLETTDGLLLGAALRGAADHVLLGPLITSGTDDDDAPESGVGLAVPAAIESVTSRRLAR
jgi:hypothetical protein